MPSPTITIHSPGRINLIGEHVDYTGGKVMPASIDKHLRFESSPLNEGHLELHARDLDETFQLPLPVRQKTGKLWVNYLAGIIEQFQQLGYTVPGLSIHFGGDLPRGAGMSSSAALEGGMAFLLNEVLDAGLTRPELAQLCQRSSNNFLGIPSGIMDQFASLNGSANGPILLDCSTLDFSPVSAHLGSYTWLLINSNITHDLSAGEYHQRVRECQLALDILQQSHPTLQHLSHATATQLSSALELMPPTVARRASYVVAENARVLAMAEALATGKAQRAGELLNATHAGLRDDYEVSCQEIDFLQSLATTEHSETVLGARIMGGGFGGCTLNLVRQDGLEAFRQAIRKAYRGEYGIEATFYPVKFGPATGRS